MFTLNDSVSKLHLVNAASQTALQRLGIKTIQDLLYYFPRDWQDLRDITTIDQIRPGEPISIRATVKQVKGIRTRWKKMHLTEALLADQTGSVLAVWFNQPYLAKQLTSGKEFFFHGKPSIYKGKNQSAVLHLSNPAFEAAKNHTIHTAAIIPVYDLTEGISQKQIRYFLKQSLASLPQTREYLPENILEENNWPDIQTALQNIHFPSGNKALKSARERLTFEELFIFQLAFLSFKQKLKRLPAPPIKFNQQLIKNFVESLPFRLTNSQRLASWDILRDLQEPSPMNRLLEGDVGSGKTVVAGIAMLQVASADWQSVLLAPTEILALQHYQTLKNLYKNSDLKITLWTRSHKIGSPISLPRRQAGKFLLPDSQIIIGTHALLQDSVKFQRIGLLVVDEQHRFGVNQRSKLQQTEHGVVPHLLSMSATPIPRTLALAFYGDLDISQLTEYPKGRKEIITRLVDPNSRDSAYEFIRKEVEKGSQVYVVTPLIGGDSTSPLPLSRPGEGGRPPRRTRARLGRPGEVEIKSVTTEFQKLQKIFPEFNIAMIHGRLPARGGSALGGKGSKEQIMKDFREGKINILVSTTVIEVGVDVPNASIMLIENAERFGLSQLHQLRGRVGRSDLQSYCLLFSESKRPETKKRLTAVARSNDGFELAELDLKLRGPGEILGARQSGYIPLKLASLSDKKLIEFSRSQADKLLAADPNLDNHQRLKEKTASLGEAIHLE